jgi:ribosomal protein S18 acetylase RimI-like enzyme
MQFYKGMISSMQIRLAQPSDIPHLQPMIARICALHEAWDQSKYGFLPDPEQRYVSWLNRLIPNSRDLCLVAEDTSQKTSEKHHLAGFLIATVEREVPIYRLKEFAFIHDLWVEERYRHTGIARQMVMQTIAHFQQLKIQQIRLDTAHVNEVARELFASCGFRISTIEMLIELN